MLPRLTKKPPKSAKLPLRERASLRFIMTWTNIISILAASLIAGYYALTLLYQNKLSDTWAIMFLELEHQGTLLTERLSTIASTREADAISDAVFRVPDGKTLMVEQGAFGKDTSLADFNLDGPSLPRDMPAITVLAHSGEAYLARIDQAGTKGERRLVLRKVAPTNFEVRPAPPASQGALYLLTREGKLLYTSDQTITDVNAVDRMLVQRFIKVPIKQGQMELTSPDGEDFYGFFAEIPKTNIVMFSEIKRSAAMAPVKKIIGRFLAVLTLILVGAVVLLQLPLSKITGPVRELAHMATSVGQGRFDVNPSIKGFGELSVLTKAFSSMASGLVERDRQVAALMQEEAEKGRMEGELAIARRIQENLLPERPLPSEAGLIIASEYISAGECAGDWYHYAYNAKKQETVVVIADVSGHGAGASVFTAVIAGLFDEFRNRDDRPFNMSEFAKSTNDVIFRLGKMQWHATMMIARFVATEPVLDLLLAGHPPPLLRTGLDGETGAISPPLRGSPVLGSSLDFKPTLRQVPFPKGSSLLTYTDGLTEAANAAGKMYLRRRVRETFLKGSGDPREALALLMEDWRGFLVSETPNDDVCVIALRAA
jgi:serine phosphatase RsbU (regulator of sigma subunit)